MSNSDGIKELRSLLDEILNKDRDEIYKKKIFQEQSFENYGKEQFEKSFKLLKKINELDFDIIDNNSISDIKTYVHKYKDLFGRATAADADDVGNDPAEWRKNLVLEAKQEFPNLYNIVKPFIDFKRDSDTSIQKLEEKAKQAVLELQRKLDEETQHLEAKSKKSDAILSAMEKASGKAGVSANAEHYKEARNEHAAKAKSWFGLGARLLVILVTFVAIAACLYLYFKKDASFTLGNFEVAAALIIVALIYAINFCSKNFHAEKHNETVNAYKDRSLTTFSSFVEAAGDDAVRDQVLLHACAAIFANPTTGFSKDQGLPLPLPAVEAAKQVSRNVKG